MPPKNCFSCSLWCKTCVARGSFSFPAHKIHCRYVNWHISTIYPRWPKICLVPISIHINKPFLRKEPISWVYIFAGNCLFTSFINGLNQLWLTEFIPASLKPQMHPPSGHHFWILVPSAWNVPTVPAGLSIALTITILVTANKLSLLSALPREQYLGWLDGLKRGGHDLVFINISEGSPNDKQNISLACKESLSKLRKG